MGGLTPTGAIGLGSSFLEYTNYIPTQASATFADVPGLEVHGMMLRLSTSTYPHGLPKAYPWLLEVIRAQSRGSLTFLLPSEAGESC